MSLCSVCEALPKVKECCDTPMCHLCINKHKCKNSVVDINRDMYQRVIDNYERKIESIHQLYNMLMDENKKLKEEVDRLYAENQGLILEIADLKEQTAMVVETDLKKKDDMPLAPPKLIRQTNIAPLERRLTIPKSGIKPKK